MFEEITQGLIGLVKSAVEDAVLHHEPRIELNDVEVSASDDTLGLVLIAIDYTVRATNSRYNMVYPFYLNEASSQGAG
jgi:phage baseplate assembly protein W